MEARAFWERFKRLVEENNAKLKNVWSERSKSGKGENPFTKEIKQVITQAINQAQGVVGVNTYYTQKEYYRIDLIGWEQKKDNDYYEINNDFGYQLSKHAWNFDIAVEHENDERDWSDEVVKLAYIFCDLRVVIGYFPYIKNETKKWELQQKYLDAVVGTIKQLNGYDNMNHGQFMIILGDVGGKEEDGFKKLIYTPYLYSGDKFIRQDW